MAKKLRITLAQLNLTVGDITGNLNKLIQSAEAARDKLSADIIVFPELAITGYPPEDLLFRTAFLEAENQALTMFKEKVKGIYCIIGHTHVTPQGLLNSCSLIYNGTLLGRYSKQNLPNYGVFDEQRYFTPGTTPYVIPINGVPVGIVICEDLWFSGPIQQSALQGARIILSPNASPFEIDKHEQRHLTLAKRAKMNRVPIVYVNNVGGQDEIIFDGGSMVIDTEGKISQHAGFFVEKLLPVDIEVTSTDTIVSSHPIDLPKEEKRIYDALVLAVRDYVKKNNFSGVLIGVSGGIDSALTLAIAVDAIGSKNVTAVLLPSRHTSDISIKDAEKQIKTLKVKHTTISIEPVFQAFEASLKNDFVNHKSDVTEENLQARCRGVLMMALSNKFNLLVLTTGNRSELAVGYATLYGDMAGGFDVLKDIPKTLVYRLAQYRNQQSLVIPDRVIKREPTAELAPNQKDQDTLPPYDILDKILELYLNQSQSIEDIIAQGFEQEVVSKIIHLIHKNEYKRRQAPPGPRINHKAFGKDWRYPITSKW